MRIELCFTDNFNGQRDAVANNLCNRLRDQ